MTTVPEGVADWLIALAILAPIAVAYINSRGQKKIQATQRSQGEALTEVRDHVANTHATNLRDDIDKIGADVREIRTHQQEQERQLFSFESRVISFVRKNHPGESI